MEIKKWKKIVGFICVFAVQVTLIGHALYRVGDQGLEVRTIQQALKEKGFHTEVNGTFTQDTKKAVLAFQRRNHLDQDGVVGPVTYEKLTGKVLVFKPLATTRKKGSQKALRLAGENSNAKEEIQVVEEMEPLHESIVEHTMPKAKKLIETAIQYRGVPYRFGGTTPNGFDCSGYVGYVFDKALHMRIPRSADEQYALGKSIPFSKLTPGDLVFFETYEKGVSHSGIYIGKGKFISATTSRGVIEADMTEGYWREHYIGAKRVLK